MFTEFRGLDFDATRVGNLLHYSFQVIQPYRDGITAVLCIAEVVQISEDGIRELGIAYKQPESNEYGRFELIKEYIHPIVLTSEIVRRINFSENELTSIRTSATIRTLNALQNYIFVTTGKELDVSGLDQTVDWLQYVETVGEHGLPKKK